MRLMTMFGGMALVLGCALGAQAVAQQAATPQPEATCVSQHIRQPNLSASDLLAKDYDVKAAVPGGIWLQKKQELFYCNAGVAKDGETMCWKLRKPVPGQRCKDAIGDVTSSDLRS